MEKTLLFYDIETTGLNKCFDQVLQFAAIRTDTDLVELERHEIDIRLNCDVVPSPDALLTHGIGLERIQQGQPEIDAIQRIHRLMNTPGTISLGYNTLGFDDEFLRFSFYRNLLTPYTHQFANQCGRMDIYPITTLFYLFKPDSLHWPIIDNKVSLKLEHLNAKNALAKGQAHDAMVDVEVTLALAKRLTTDSAMWAYVIDYFDKKVDIERANNLPIFLENDHTITREGLIVQGKLGASNQFIAPVISLGQHTQYKNQTLWLRVDSEALLKADTDNFKEHTYIIRKKMGEQDILLPPQARFMEKVSKERQAIADACKQKLHDDPKLLQTIAAYYQQYEYPTVPHLDVDAALYDSGFPSRYETQQFAAFLKAPVEEKYALAERFENPKRREQAHRLLARHYPEQLPDEMLCDIKEGMFDPEAQDYRGTQRLTPQKALARISELNNTPLSATQTALLNRLSDYLGRLITHPA